MNGCRLATGVPLPPDLPDTPAFPMRDAICPLTTLDTSGTTEKMGMEYFHWPTQMKTVEIPYLPRNEFVRYALETFGKPKRNSTVQCDCERDGTASVLQVLSLANDPRVWAKISDERGQVSHIAREIGGDKKRIEELILVTLGRLPTDGEREACTKYLKASQSAQKGLQGVMWSLMNTKEFLLQH
jgi:hypothetical protein